MLSYMRITITIDDQLLDLGEPKSGAAVNDNDTLCEFMERDG